FDGSVTARPDPSGTGTVGEWPRLTSAALDRVVAKIKVVHATALFRRRHRLRGDVVAAVNAEHGVKTAYSAIGPLTVVCGAAQHLVWITTRPAEVDDFRMIQ